MFPSTVEADSHAFIAVGHLASSAAEASISPPPPTTSVTSQAGEFFIT